VLCAALVVGACATAPPADERKPFAGQWPAVISGPGPAQLTALTFMPGGMLAAGRSDRGVAVAQKNVSTVPGPFVVALDEVGMPQWGRALETTGVASIDAIAVVPGPAVVFVGSFEGEIVSDDHKITSEKLDCMIGRMKVDGSLSWLRTLGGPGNETCRSLALGKDGSLWVTGSYTEGFDDLPPPKGTSDVMVLQLDESTGERRSSFTFGSGGDDHGHHVTVVGERDLIVTGNFGGRFDTSGKLVVPADHAVLELSEELRLVPVGDYDGFVARFDDAGTPLWATAVSGPGYDLVSHVVAHHDGWLVSGVQQQDAPPTDTPGLTTDIPQQGFVARLQDDGGLAWTWSDPLMASINEVAVVRDRIAALGQHRDGFQIGGGRWRVVGATGVTLVLLDDDGKLVGGYGCDSPGDDRATAIATTPDGRVALGGTTSAGGGCALVPGSAPAGFVRLMVLDPQGELRPLVVE
jgi:hypothetical protein